MTHDEIVRALRVISSGFAKPGQEVIGGAADLIESLQAQLLDEKVASQSLRNAASYYETQLAASQRRADAAVELIGKVSQAVEVAFNATDYVKPNTGIWHTLGLALDWIKAWRGPQEAGKGDSHGTE